MRKLRLIGLMNFIPSFALIILLFHALFLLWKHSAEVLSKQKVITLFLSITFYQIAVMFLFLRRLAYSTIIEIQVIGAVLLMTLEMMFCEIAKLQLHHQGQERSASED